MSFYLPIKYNKKPLYGRFVLAKSDLNINDASIISSNRRVYAGRVPNIFSPLLLICNQSLIRVIPKTRRTLKPSISKSNA